MGLKMNRTVPRWKKPVTTDKSQWRMLRSFRQVEKSEREANIELVPMILGKEACFWLILSRSPKCISRASCYNVDVR